MQLLELSEQILDPTKAVYAYAASRSDGVAPKTDTWIRRCGAERRPDATATLQVLGRLLLGSC